MRYNPENHHRCSIRLKNYDYAQAGAYFITIGTQNREGLFGEISDGQMVLNDGGRLADKCWHDIPVHFLHVELDEGVIMPNHVHEILFIVDTTVATVLKVNKNFTNY